MTEAPRCGRSERACERRRRCAKNFAVSSDDMTCSIASTSSKVWWLGFFASAPYFASALANSPLRKVSGPVCCGEVDVKIADDRISSQRAGALLRSRASGR